jgi:glutaredoxin 3
MAPEQPAPTTPPAPPPPVAKVDFYRRRFGADCMRAKALLDRKGVTYNEFIIDSDDESRQVMLKRSGGNSKVPQIFINGRAIDGIELLEALDASGQLDVVLGEGARDVHAEEAKVARESKEGEAVSGSIGLRGILARFGRP